MSIYELVQPLFEHLGEIQGFIERTKTVIQAQKQAFSELMQIANRLSINISNEPKNASEILSTPNSLANEEQIKAYHTIQKILALCQDPQSQSHAIPILTEIQQLITSLFPPVVKIKKKSTRKKSTSTASKLLDEKSTELVTRKKIVKKSTKKSKKSTKKATSKVQPVE